MALMFLTCEKGRLERVFPEAGKMIEEQLGHAGIKRGILVIKSKMYC